MDVEEVARHALTHGTVDTAGRSAFAPGEAKALALDTHDGIAAVLVIRRRRDDRWIVDIAKFVDEAAGWTSLGSGGGTYGNLPIDHDRTAAPSLGPVTTSWSMLDERGLVAVGGFVIGAVDAVELVLGGLSRRVTLTPGSSAFVVAIETGEDDDFDALDVRAVDVRGVVVDSTAALRAERRASQPGITVAEALALPDGTEVMVRGILLALPGQSPMLCDDLEQGASLRCRGRGLRLDLGGPVPPTNVEGGGLSTVMLMVSGVVREGVLTPTD